MYKARVKTPVVPVRKEAQDSSEQITQFLYGELLTVIEEEKQWRKCVSDIDEYAGWLDQKMIYRVEEHSEKRQFLTVSAAEWIEINGQRKLIPAGSYLSDQEMGTLKSVDRSPFEHASLFLGAPYLWGGKTIMGIDCSGLTQVAFAMANNKLPRDAYQQAEIGETVSFVDEAQTNDLAYFDNVEGKIIHVGIIRRNGKDLEIIHANGEVRIDQLDHQGIFKKETGKYSHQLRIIKRVK